MAKPTPTRATPMTTPQDPLFGYDTRSLDDEYADAAKRVRAVAVQISGPDVGCGDGGCVFGHPGGQHTNGGCRCLSFTDEGRTLEAARKLARVAQGLALQQVRERDTLRARVEHAREFGDALKHDDVLGWIG